MAEEKQAVDTATTDKPSDPPTADATAAEGKPEANNGTGDADLAALVRQRAQALLGETAESLTTEAEITVKAEEEAESKDEAETDDVATTSMLADPAALKEFIADVMFEVLREEFFEKAKAAEAATKSAQKAAEESAKSAAASVAEAKEAKEKAQAAEKTAWMRTEEQVTLVSQAYQSQHASELRTIKQNSDEMRQAWTQVAPTFEDQKKAATELRDLRQAVVGPDGKRRSLRDVYAAVLQGVEDAKKEHAAARQERLAAEKILSQVAKARDEIVAALKGETPPPTDTGGADEDEI